MRTILLLTFPLCFIFSSCSNYDNKEKYEVEVGEEFEIYYTTNSCCFYCLGNEKELKHIDIIRGRRVDGASCDGCDFTAAFVFKALSPGTDTVKLFSHLGGSECGDSTKQIEYYPVLVFNNIP